VGEMAADIIGKQYNLRRNTTSTNKSSKGSNSYLSIVVGGLLLVAGLFVYGGGDLKRDLPLMITKAVKGQV
jgi:hypothetical protein